jgi:hypothetical protein
VANEVNKISWSSVIMVEQSPAKREGRREGERENRAVKLESELKRFVSQFTKIVVAKISYHQKDFCF